MDQPEQKEPVFYTAEQLHTSSEAQRFIYPEPENHSNDVGLTLFGLILVLIPLGFMRTYLEPGAELVTLFLVAVIGVGSGMMMAGLMKQRSLLKIQRSVSAYSASTYDNQFDKHVVPITPRDAFVLRFTGITGLAISVFELFVFISSIVDYVLRLYGGL